jgi:2-iminobutanoate/2-iminopropanoate deaminase
MKQALFTEKAPAAIGPYSQALRTGEWIFISGQIPLDPVSGQIVQGDVTAQSERVMKNLDALLAAAGSSFADVVKTTVYLVDLAHFAAVNEVYARWFEPPYPARATVQVAALPRGALVEIDAIAIARG